MAYTYYTFTRATARAAKKGASTRAAILRARDRKAEGFADWHNAKADAEMGAGA
jgi:hypothetical protein